MVTELDFFATAPKGLSEALAGELTALGAREVVAEVAGAAFRGPLALGYRACLWSRVASRVLLPLGEIAAGTAEELYDGVRAVRWREHLSPKGTLAISVTGEGPAFPSPLFAAQKAKDAIVDQLRDAAGVRPDVSRERPDLQLSIYLQGETAVLSIDLAGEALHRRGYRGRGGGAPLKENLAAAILLLADWPARAARGEPLCDPLCGSGTFLAEAALIAGDVAPALGRDYFGFSGWLGHEPQTWRELVAEARERRAAGADKIPALIGYDADLGAIRAARGNLAALELRRAPIFERRPVLTATPPVGLAPGLVVANPPYGERLGEKVDLQGLYAALGGQLRAEFPGWTAFVLTADDDLGRRLGLRATRRWRLYNGPIPVRLLELPIAAPSDAALAAVGEEPRDDAGRTALANRLRKNQKRLRRWAERERVEAYRIYDADLPEYAVAIDRYGEWAVVQEYQAPADIPPAKAARRLQDTLAVVPTALGVERERLVVKVRRRQRHEAGYTKLDDQRRYRQVQEGDCRFYVNLTDYLDTGLFLDGRGVRRLVAALAAGRRFLNLFCYTATASVCAARAGARSTTSVDLSTTYLDWAQRNFELNELWSAAQRLVRDDGLSWLVNCREQFDLVLLDPPTYSNSKSLRQDFDLERDQVQLLRETLRLLAPEGRLLFVNHQRRFKPRFDEVGGLAVEEITTRTLDPDFPRRPPPHRAWLLRHA